MIYEPRDYQSAAVDAMWSALRQRRESKPLAVLPTGAGKSVVLAEFGRRVAEGWSAARILVATHKRELVEQDAEKLTAMLGADRVGVYCAGLKRHDVGRPVTVASIQSIAHRLDEIDRVDLMIVDEAHLIPHKGSGRYRKVIDGLKKRNPRFRVAGLTATPYRMSSGLLHKGDGAIFTEICVDVPIPELIDRGFLSPLRSKRGVASADVSGVRTRGGDYVPSELAKAVNDADVVRGAVSEIVKHAADRKSILVFAAGIDHALMVREEMAAQGIKASCVFGSTPAGERDRIIAGFRAGLIRAIVNVDVLTTGFDAPAIDCVVMLRPTKSPGLYYQMVGRGIRVAPGKKDCLILDFTDNVMTHGPIDRLSTIAPSSGGKRSAGAGEPPFKICPSCRECVHAALGSCSCCGYAFPVVEEAPHGTRASEAALLSRDEHIDEVDVTKIEYKIHSKAGKPDSLRVNYRVGIRWISEWVCFEHPGFARKKAIDWWRTRSKTPAPDSVADALARIGECREPARLDIQRNGGKYWRVKRAYF